MIYFLQATPTQLQALLEKLVALQADLEAACNYVELDEAEGWLAYMQMTIICAIKRQEREAQKRLPADY